MNEWHRGAYRISTNKHLLDVSAVHAFLSASYWAVGIDEDPVTGSAHCCLGPFWRERLGRDSFVAYQASARGGRLTVRVADERVILGGQAVTVLRGELVEQVVAQGGNV